MSIKKSDKEKENRYIELKLQLNNIDQFPPR